MKCGWSVRICDLGNKSGQNLFLLLAGVQFTSVTSQQNVSMSNEICISCQLKIGAEYIERYCFNWQGTLDFHSALVKFNLVTSEKWLTD
jgi:hypothetical protein